MCQIWYVLSSPCIHICMYDECKCKNAIVYSVDFYPVIIALFPLFFQAFACFPKIFPSLSCICGKLSSCSTPEVLLEAVISALHSAVTFFTQKLRNQQLFWIFLPVVTSVSVQQNRYRKMRIRLPHFLLFPAFILVLCFFRQSGFFFFKNIIA